MLPDPHKFQTKVMKFMDKGRALVAMEMGTGKTPTTLWWADNTPGAYPLLVVAPAGLKGNWEAEAWKFLQRRALVLNGRRPPLHFHCSHEIVIANYEILDAWLEPLLKHGFQTLAVDEAHYCKSRTALRTKHIRKLARKIPNVFLLTGTPILNRHAELWPLLNILDQKKWGSFFTFAMQYTNARKRPWGWEYNGSTNAEQLHEECKSVMVRVRKQDVIKDLPEKQRVVVRLSLSAAARKEYNKAFSDFIGWLKQVGLEKATTAARAMALTKTNYLKRLAAQLKLPAVFEWLDNFLGETDGKACVFCFHRSIIDALSDRYKKLSVRIDGGTPKHERTHIVNSFNESQDKRLFIGQAEAAGVGLNITGAHTVVFAEMLWTPALHIQCEDRCYARLSDMHGVQAFYLVAENTVEADNVRILHEKQQVYDAVVDGETSGAGESVFNTLLAQLFE